MWLASTEVLLARERAGTADGLTLVVKGGHNAEHHNHNDVGSFIVASDGVPVVVDAGRPTYTKATFSPERYDIWTMQSSWHNTPTIAGVDQSPGRAFAASAVVASISDAVSQLTLEIDGAYEVDELSWRRNVALDRDAGVVRVSDAWRCAPAINEATQLNLVVAGTVSTLENGIRIAPLDDATPVVIRWADGIRSTFRVRALDDPMLSDVWGERLTRLELHVSAREDAWITVERDIVTPGTSGSEDES